MVRVETSLNCKCDYGNGDCTHFEVCMWIQQEEGHLNVKKRGLREVNVCVFGFQWPKI